MQTRIVRTLTDVFDRQLWIGFAWGLVYILIDSIGLVFVELYNFNSWQVGLVFLTLT